MTIFSEPRPLTCGTRTRGCAIIAALAFAVLLSAQTTPQLPEPVGVQLDTIALEAYFRHLLVWPPSVEVTIGKPTPAPMPGFYKSKITGSLGGKAQEEIFYISADSQTIIRGEILDVKKNPFQTELDLLKTSDQPFLGMPGAPVTVVEFADFQCPYCKQEAGVVRNKLMEAFPGDIQLFYMDYPLDAIHPFARGAAVLGRCIYTQNSASFWNYHDWIFDHQAEITADNLREKVLAFAQGDKNLDVARLTSCATAPEPRADVDRSVAIGDALKISATPTFFINGRRLVGTISIDDLKTVVEQEIGWAKAQKKAAADCCSVQLSLPGMGLAPSAPGSGKAAPK
jgi:protein-disulfide isomerase